jgi:hypothetical protein
MTATRITPSPVQAPASRLTGSRGAAPTVLMFRTFMFVLDFSS